MGIIRLSLGNHRALKLLVLEMSLSNAFTSVCECSFMYVVNLRIKSTVMSYLWFTVLRSQTEALCICSKSVHH